MNENCCPNASIGAQIRKSDMYFEKRMITLASFLKIPAIFFLKQGRDHRWKAPLHFPLCG
jgi:hypothetical protein